MWIRNRWWDSFWILSAPALGMLMLLPLVMPAPTEMITGALLCVGMGHTLSPIVLAWSHRGFRGVMLQRPGKFLGVPAFLIASGVGVAVTTSVLFPAFQPVHIMLESLTLDEAAVPMVIWINLYALWNLYHGGAQNFGLLCLYRRRGWRGYRKLAILALCVAAVIFLSYGMPRIFGYRAVALFFLGFVTVNHWLAAIGLSAHVHAQHYKCSPLWFAIGVILAGGLLMWGYHAMILGSIAVKIMGFCLRASLGIWHFLQDRWIWKLSDPQVRATIGKELFA